MTSSKEIVLPVKREKRITVLISGSGTNLQALLDASNSSILPGRITHVISSRSKAYGLIRASSQNPPIPTTIIALKTFLSRNPGSTREDYDVEVARLVLTNKPDLVVLAGWMHILSDSFLDILNGVREAPSAPTSSSPKPESSNTQTEPIPSVFDGETDTTFSFNQETEIGTLPLSSLGEDIIDSLSRRATIAMASKREKEEIENYQGEIYFPIPIINLHPALPGAFDGANAIGRAYEAFQKGEINKTGVMVHRVVREVDRGEPLVVREIEMRVGESQEELEKRIHEVEHEIIVEGAKKVLEGLT
ncbi:hypothetical protein TREMEDRAFT_73716 [Tremella mesenterica DSM 1558]|uniref:uncharacterized protein n=1 Tax=Tremella mesenterica (strain ATCC 24925 / CBS 8224 / DSM 1558 / NBRC 9311 / NRRL Y-6157 / RJB 2259-6 / UBC 559-6) TaxID=578456 RepID=UPI0003F49849|nr:uncharacterized protein TREMEDRAFT_73716 [Tremella mesenterica DSM 1558]EIW70068.1 hypothetical protein TREMEDRAFT_73716 [Tremella mesenterica DSM 1558]